MPAVFRHGRLRFFFFSNEGWPREPPHVHDEHNMWVELTDGRTLGVPLAWFPRLLHAAPLDRAKLEISRIGLHWEDLDEDISIAGLLAGRGDMTTHGAAV
jgi:hypothetical protein